MEIRGREGRTASAFVVAAAAAEESAHCEEGWVWSIGLDWIG